MTSPLPRFTGPAQARQRMRLAAALGLLAIAALATGGLASLTAGKPVLPPRQPRPAPADPAQARAQDQTSAELPDLIDAGALVEARVADAERARARARAALQSARQLGLLDPPALDALEQRLEGGAADRPSLIAPNPAPATPEPGSKLLDPQPRSL